MSLTRLALVAILLLPLTLPAQQPKQREAWREIIQTRLSLFGHRNWIVIADAAYPLHSGPGIETVDSDQDQISTVRTVLAAIRRSRNLRPVVFMDAELARVPEADALGIGTYRQELLSFVKDSIPLPHDELIHRIDEAGRTFNVLIVKTNMLLPYTSVFIELRASYWSDEAEQRLRQSIRP